VTDTKKAPIGAVTPFELSGSYTWSLILR